MLTRLNLVDFRCYEQLRMTLPSAGALFLGDNAQGKTTLLEAMCVLLRMQSPRTSRHAQMIRLGTGQFGVSGVFEGARRRILWDAKAPEYMVDGEKRPDQRSYLSDSGLIVWLGNDDMGLVRGMAEQRRRYLDFLGVQWHGSYRVSLGRYKRALKSRNALLKSVRHDLDQIAAYTQLLMEHGSELITLRKELIEELQPHVAESCHLIGGREEDVTLSYRPSAKLPLEEAWTRTLSRDLLLGATQVGPHRDDMELLVKGQPAADFTSEGQQRTLALSLKLAQHRLLVEKTGKTPLLLMDDVFGELDPGRRSALLGALPGGTQTFITTTHLSWLKDTPLSIPSFTLSGGGIIPD